jgi:hypothetical protein
MKKSTIILLSFLGFLIIGGFILATQFFSFSNSENRLRNKFNAEMKNRTAFYDKMYKTISQKSQIAVRNDSSFKDNIHMIMDARKDGEQVFFKWIQESNPNANFSEVSVLYKDLSRAVEAERQAFFIREETLSDIVNQHDNLLTVYPGAFYNIFLGRSSLDYKPISSDRTEDVMKTGKDNDTKLF